MIFFEGLTPGGGGDRVNTFFVPFAPWNRRSTTILRFKKMAGTLVYIYLTYDTLSTFGARISADGHTLVQQTIPLSSFVWYLDPSDGEYYRLLVNKGHEQLVLSVKDATVSRSTNSWRTFSQVIALLTKPRSESSLRSRLSTRTINRGYIQELTSGMWQNH